MNERCKAFSRVIDGLQCELEVHHLAAHLHGVHSWYDFAADQSGGELADQRPMPTVTPEQAMESLNEFIRFWRRVGGDQGDAPDAHLVRRFIEQQTRQFYPQAGRAQ